MSNPASLAASDSSRRAFEPDSNSRSQTDLHARLRFYHALSQHSGMPPVQVHAAILPASLFIPLFAASANEGDQSSIVTIFSIWSCMCGASMLAMPWGFSQAGFSMSIVVMVVVGAISLATAQLVLSAGNTLGENEFGEIAGRYLGPWGKWASWASSVLILVGACTAYHILMSQSLYSSLSAFYYYATHSDISSSHGYFRYWSPKTAPIVAMLLVLPLVNIKDFSVLVRINSIGVFCIMYLVIFMITGSISEHPIDFPEVEEYDHRFFYFAGMLMLSFFIHNAVLTITSNAKKPENNARDLTIAYILVGATYASVGGIGYLTFDKFVDWNLPVAQNFLELFDPRAIYPLTARFSVFLLLYTVLPLIACIIRIQFFGTLWDSVFPSRGHVFLLNAALLGTTTLFAVYYPQVGTVLRFTGAICGYLYIFIIPLFVQYFMERQRKTLTTRKLVLGIFMLLVGAAVSASQFIPASPAPSPVPHPTPVPPHPHPSHLPHPLM